MGILPNWENINFSENTGISGSLPAGCPQLLSGRNRHTRTTSGNTPKLWITVWKRVFGSKKIFSKSLFCTNGLTVLSLKIPLFTGLYSFWLVNRQPLHKPAEFLSCKRSYFRCVPWPLETAVIKSLLQDYEAVLVKV